MSLDNKVCNGQRFLCSMVTEWPLLHMRTPSNNGCGDIVLTLSLAFKETKLFLDTTCGYMLETSVCSFECYSGSIGGE